MEMFIMKQKFNVSVIFVDYYITQNDLGIDVSEECDEKTIVDIMNGLPQEMKLQIECEPEALYDYVVEKISIITGQLVNSVEYKIVS